MEHEWQVEVRRRNMHILMLAQFYPPIIGGEERHVRNLSIELARRGHQVAVVTLHGEGSPELEEDCGVRIYRVRGSMQRVKMLFSEEGRTHAPPFPDPEVLWSLRRIILREKPDVVHAHNWMVHSFLPLRRWSRAKLVVTLHDFSLICASKLLMYQKELCSGPALSKCLSCVSDKYGVTKGIPTLVAHAVGGRLERNVVDMFLPASQAVAEGTQLIGSGLPYRIVSNFVADRIETLDDTEHTENEAHVLLKELPQEEFMLFVGDVMRVKGVEVLFQAYAGLEERMPLVVIGRPVNDFAVGYPANVRVLQSWPHKAVMSAWKRSSIALVPSICRDSSPTVAMEAMYMGKPVIASCIGGLPDIVADGETGILVQPGNPLALREAMHTLIHNAVLRQHMGIRAKQRVTEFQATKVVSRIEAIYRELVY
ncbi:MAG TPA: glycosyltransferase family 1 protein [Ktedonobacter sp.]|nr:glycosyltransferase family 1 protein [Ktedonobacter sp.]